MWNTIISHKKQLEQLHRAIKNANLAHAYLFTGIDGIGKRLTAKTTALALTCKNLRDDVTPCLTCTSCQKIMKGFHPDVLEIAPENSQITIGKIREIKEKLRFSPLEATRRIIIIDAAESMNANAANAALKILEEPPTNNHFFLITSTPEKLLPTIVSRCQKIEFSPLTNAQIIEFLEKRSGLDPETAKKSAEISEGSLATALTMSPELIDSTITTLKNLISNPTATDVIKTSEEWSNKEEIGQILYIIHHFFHDELLRCAEKAKSVRFTEKCQLINKAHTDATRTYNKQLMFEQLLFTLLA